MAKSKAYLSFVLLFAVFLFSQVLTHELPEEKRIPTYNAEAHELKGPTSGSVDYHPNDFQWTTPTVSPNAEKDHHTTHSVGYYPSDYGWAGIPILPMLGEVIPFPVQPRPDPGNVIPFPKTGNVIQFPRGNVIQFPKQVYPDLIANPTPPTPLPSPRRFSPIFVLVPPKVERGPMDATRSIGYYPGYGDTDEETMN